MGQKREEERDAAEESKVPALLPQRPHLSGDSARRGWLHSLSRMAIADREVETREEANQGSKTHLPLPGAMASSPLLCNWGEMEKSRL